jgi:hypothetical protein
MFKAAAYMTQFVGDDADPRRTEARCARDAMQSSHNTEMATCHWKSREIHTVVTRNHCRWQVPKQIAQDKSPNVDLGITSWTERPDVRDWSAIAPSM